jgi:hypothetical protein
MKRAAAMLPSGQGAAFEARPRARRVAPGSAPPGNEGMVGATLISVVAAGFFTMLIQDALSFQKYRFDKGLMLGTTMAAVNWYEVVARRKHLRPSRVTLILIATIAAAFMVAVQHGVGVLAADLPLTHS